MAEIDQGLRLATLLASDLVDSTRIIERLGDQPAVDLLRRHDRLARDLMAEYGGREIDKTDGFLLLFGRPTDAVLYAIAYQDQLAELGANVGLPLSARIGIHIGEVMIRDNSSADIARGAKPVEVEGLAKPVVARVMSLGGARQILLTRGGFDVARRGALGTRLADQGLTWLAHGAYVAKGIDDPIEIFEVGRTGFSPLTPPGETDKVRRVPDPDAIVGWRPAPGIEIPGRANWVLQEKAGSGGFGEVWRAEHRKTGDQRVYKFCYDLGKLKALKREVTLVRLLKEELGDRRDIARIIDWNFDEVPYFIESEWTEAGSLDLWLARRGGAAAVALPVRLEIVAQVADALAAAHSVGVLHKDIKPANILMNEDADGSPRAKLTDFGIGLLTEHERLAKAGITEVGFTALAEDDDTGGTRLYMAPELLEGKPSTIHADAYALGVVLFQLVIGDLTRTVGEGWEREVADPLLRETIAAAVDGRPESRISVRRLAEELRNLEPRRAERVRHANAQLHIEKVRKRWRWLALAGAGFGLAGVATAIQLRRVAHEATRANRAAETSRQVSEFMTDLFRLADPGEARGNSVTAREILDVGVRRIESGLKDQPEVQATLMGTMGNVYLGLGLAGSAKPLLEKSLSIRRRLFGDNAPETADGLIPMGEVSYALGDYSGAEDYFRQAATSRTKRGGPNDPGVAEALEGVTRTLWRRGKYPEALDAGQQALAIYRSSSGHEAGLATTLNRLGIVRASTGHFPEADSLLRESLALTRTAYGPEDRRVAQIMNNLGIVLTAERKFDEASQYARQALALYKKLLGEKHPLVGTSSSALALLLHQQGKLEEAEQLQREALSVDSASYGMNHMETASAMSMLAWVLTDAGRCAEAEPLARRTRETMSKMFPGGHVIISEAESILGECLGKRGQDREAEPLLVNSYPVIQKTQKGFWAMAALKRLIDFYDRRGNKTKADEYRRLLPTPPVAPGH